MAGSHVAVIVMPIVIAVCLVFWISIVYYASFHPQWKHHGRPPRTEVAGGAFEATHGGRQLQPLWGEPVEAVPQPREAATAETYQAAQADAADAQGPDQEHAGATARGATATGSRPPGESGPAGSGWPPDMA
jgi:hypothetical protein